MSILKSTLAKALLIILAATLSLTAGSAGASAAPAASTAAGVTAVVHPQVVKKYTLATVAKHNKKTNCWSVVGKNVYKLTVYIKKHPGGSKRIIAMCGKNATAAFRGQHGSTGKAASALKRYKIGVLT
jgi:cytochrome b involved in lipid metabolism